MVRSRRLIPICVLCLLLTRAVLAEVEAAPAPIVIEAPLFQGGSGSQFYLECAREYEKIRPGVTIDLYLDPRIQDKVQVRFLEGTFFETTNVSMNFWPLIRNGDVLAMNEFLEGPNWEGDAKWGDTFLPGSLDRYKENGKIYGIPLGYYASVIWYNKAMFREHGWTKPRTWDELFALCEKVKAAGIAPLAFQGRYPYYAYPFYEHATYHLGGVEQWEQRRALEPGAIASEHSVQAIALLRKLSQNYFQPGAMGMSHTESQLQFFLGKTAMIPCGAWLKSEMQGKIPDGFELGCFNLPLPDDPRADPTTVSAAVEPFLVFSKSKHPKACVDFLRFMTSRAQAGKFARMQDIPTAIRGSNEGKLSKDLDEVIQLVNAAKSAYSPDPGGAYPEMFQIYQDMMYDAMANNALSPRQIAEVYEKRGQALRTMRLNPERYNVNHVWRPAVFLGFLGLGAIYLIWRAATRFTRRAKSRVAAAASTSSLQRMGFGNVLLFVGPAVVIYTVFVVFPSLRSLSWSLHEWNGLTDINNMPFIGLLNFKRLLLEYDAFWIALRNNLFLMFVVPLFVVPLALFLAAAISRGIWGARVFRVVFFFPNLVGGVAATLLWLHMYNPQGGLVNTALAGLGFDAMRDFAWLEPKNLYWAMIPIMIWGACGFHMILYLAAMESIPESYYEAARIDGASQSRQFWTITVPLIWDVLTVSIVFLVIAGMKAFEIVWLLCNQRPQTDNHVIATRMVQTMFTEFRVGEATAIAVLLFLMVFIGTAATMRGMRRETVEM